MNTLALDLGTKCGYAIRTEEGRVVSGTWQLSSPDCIGAARADGLDRRCDPRFEALFNQINAAVGLYMIKKIVFEDVLFSEYTLQTQLWSSLRSTVWATRLTFPEMELDCVNTATLKKYATGNGQATKKMMSAHLLRKYPQEFVKNPKPTENCFLLRKDGTRVDDNEVDARHLLDYFC